jgi:glucosyl-dolichyl phosphate glucuronosyltransferase
VVICAFTPERLPALGEAIEAVGKQSAAPDEIILVVDHSPQLLEEARERWPQVRVVESRGEKGLSGARNTGVEESKGDVIAFLDDDAVPEPDWLRRLLDAYADDEVLGVGGTVRPRWLEGKPDWFPDEFDWVVGCTHSGMPSRRSPVRNLVGANMSFRRDAVLEAGGFRSELGRIGTLPVGCEETDLCIRIGKRRPQGEIVYDPAASVEHLVPGTRGTVRYFRERCAAEGRSKAVLTRMVGSAAGLSSERSYVRRTLPLGFLGGLRDALRGDASGIKRAGMIVVGLITTTVGYLRGRAARKPR